MLCIGLTGTIASGKSTVANLFAELGVSIISADEIAKSLTKTQQPALESIIERFGKSILKPDGELDRRKLRDKIFSNIADKLWLENLLHPLIRQKIAEEIKLVKGPYCIIEIPLLINKASYPYIRKILLVTSTKKQQITRIIERDKCQRKDAIAILKNQAPKSAYKALADDILKNNSNFKELKEKVLKLHLGFLSQSPGFESEP